MMRAAVLPALLLAGCVGVAGDAGAPLAAGPPEGYYEGVLPCADCAGLSHALALRPDHLFLLQTTYLGEPLSEVNPRSVAGAWSLSADERILILSGAGEALLYFGRESPGVLRKLDRDARAIDSAASHDLVVASPRGAFEPLVTLTGEFTYMADAAGFRECLSAARLPVAMEDAYLELERAYLAARPSPGAAVLVSVDARIRRQPDMEGGLRDMLIVERVKRVIPGEFCPPPLSLAPLAGTDWRLIRLGDRPVVMPAGMPEPNLLLRDEGPQAAGFAGCNRFTGTFRRDGQALGIGPLAVTRRACVAGMALEGEYLAALQATARWNVLAGVLELYDAQGNTLARFGAGQRP